MSPTNSMRCEDVDELAGAYALGAVDAAEGHALAEHLRTCRESHAEARSLVGAGGALELALEPVAAPSALRARILQTVAEAPQDHVASQARTGSPSASRPWWRAFSPAAGVAAVALALAVGFGAWGMSLNNELTAREEALRAVAAADAAFAAHGSAGSGWVIETDGHAHFVAAGLADLPEDQIYELWLIGEDGTPEAAGTFGDGEDLVIVPIEGTVGEATTFAVTVEPHRVDAPTGDPVLTAALGG